MNYIAWAVVALACYSIFTPLVSLATNVHGVPSNVAALITNGMLAVCALAVVLYEGDDVTRHLTSQNLLYLVGAGAFLTVGILAYYRALSEGPASVVVPIFGSFIVFSSILSVVFLNDSFSIQKVAGIGLAIVGIYLTTR